MPQDSFQKKSIRKRKRRYKSHFLRNLLIFIAIVLTMIVCSFFRLWHYLDDYQQALPSMLGDEILAAYQSADTTMIKKYCSALPEALQDDMIFHNYLNKVVGKEDLYYYESKVENNEDTITYTINNSEQKFAELVVAKTGMESKYGFPLYEIRSLEQYSLSEYTLIAGPGTSLYFNDNPIDTAYQTEQETVASVFEQIETGPYYKTTYLMPDYLLTSSIRACDSSGNECALVWNDDHTIGTASLVPSETMQQDLTTIAENTAKAYAVFATIKYAPRDILLTYLYPDTDFSKAIRTYDNDWGITKTADSFDQVTTSDFVQYSESEYSCVVSFHYIVTQGSTKKDYPLSFTCYITNRNGKLQIVNLETNK
ncbi:MAG: hypothetical protein PHS74_06440 [Lachnospiraceae bacterium]|nr:hypothetical protein [Lachnospiraceae bacterium]